MRGHDQKRLANHHQNQLFKFRSSFYASSVSLKYMKKVCFAVSLMLFSFIEIEHCDHETETEIPTPCIGHMPETPFLNRLMLLS